MKNAAIIIMVCLLCYGCSKGTQKEITFLTINKPELYATQVPKLNTPNRDFKWSISESNNEQILIRSSSTGSNLIVNFLKIDSLKTLPTLTLPSNGPNGYNSFSPIVHYHNNDSIFILTTSINKIVQYNISGTKKRTLEIGHDMPLSLDTNEEQQSFALLKEYLVGHAVPYADPNDKSFFSKTSSHIQVSLNDGTVSEKDYPITFHGKVLPTQFLGGHAIKLNETEYIFSDFRSHKVQIFNIRNNDKRIIDFGINGLDEFEPQDDRVNNSSLEKAIQVLRHPKYYAFIYDKRNGVFYRFAKFLNPVYKSLSDMELIEQMRTDNLNLLKNVAIAFDSDFSKKVYFELPNHSFYVPYKNGLLTSSFSESDLNTEEFYFYDLKNVMENLNKK